MRARVESVGYCVGHFRLTRPFSAADRPHSGQ
jgi:hypothetical protein